MKTIQLKQYGMGRYGDVSPFPMGDLEIELQGLPSYEGEFRFVAQCNGVKCAECRVTPMQNRMNIPRRRGQIFGSLYMATVLQMLALG